jgi:hypothetical protein
MLPVNEDGEISIGRVNAAGEMQIYEDVVDENGILKTKRIEGLWYKGVHYKGRAVFDGLYQIAVDIRMFEYDRPLSEIIEALTLVNSIYADATTLLKPKQIASAAFSVGERAIAIRDDNKIVSPLTVGLTEIMDKIAVPIMFAGHNTISKLNKENIKEIVLDSDGHVMIVNVDDDMSPKYGGRGSYKMYNPEIGIIKAGYKGENDAVKIFFQGKVAASKGSFIGRVTSNLNMLLLEIQIFKQNNSIILNLDIEGKSGREKIELLRDAQAYNLEIVKASDISLFSSFDPVIIKEKIEVFERVFDIAIVKVDNGTDITRAYQVIIPSSEETSFLKRSFREAVLAKAASLIISANSDKKFIVVAPSITRFEHIRELPAGIVERTVFMTEKPKKITENNVSRLKIQPQVLDSLTRAFGANLSFEMLPFSDYKEKEDILPKTQVSEFTQSILSAA